MTLRTVRLWLWGVVAVAAGVLVGVAWIVPGTVPSRVASTTSLTPIGGEFDLVDEDGKPRTWAGFRGKPVAVFFGFTHCPDICPTTLGELSVLLADLGPRSDDLQVVLVSGDPERDTPEVLNAYLQSFDPRIVGLTGPEAEVDRAFASFKAYRRKVPTEVATIRSITRPGSTSTTAMEASPGRSTCMRTRRSGGRRWNVCSRSRRGSRAPCWRSSAGSGPPPGWFPKGSPPPHAVPDPGS